MSSVLNTNMAALTVQKNLTNAQSSLSKALERLSSGVRINHASDDAAGLAMANTLQTQLSTGQQAVRNVGDALSLLQATESAFSAASELAQRISTLVTQGQSGTNSTEQRTMIAAELTKLMTSITNVGARAMFGSKALLSGTGTAVVIQMSGKSGDTLTLDAANFASIGADVDQTKGKALSEAIAALNAAASGSNPLPLTVTANWDAVATAATAYLNDLATRRASIGAQQNQLEYSLTNLYEMNTAMAAAKSRILDTDYDSEMSQLTRDQILQQAATAMLTQANQMPNSILSLIKG